MTHGQFRCDASLLDHALGRQDAAPKERDDWIVAVLDRGVKIDTPQSGELVEPEIPRCV